MYIYIYIICTYQSRIPGARPIKMTYLLAPESDIRQIRGGYD